MVLGATASIDKHNHFLMKNFIKHIFCANQMLSEVFSCAFQHLVMAALTERQKS
jgi:hypothetical protein